MPAVPEPRPKPTTAVAVVEECEFENKKRSIFAFDGKKNWFFSMNIV
jgi:hypothetical protein